MSSGETFPKIKPQAAWRALAGAVLCGLALHPAAALAGPNDTATTAGGGQAVLVTPLSLVKVRDMDFGRIGARPVAGTVVMDPVSANCVAGGTLIHSGACVPAEFAGFGARLMLVRFQLPNSVNLTGPGTTMVLDTLTLDGGSELGLPLIGGGGGPLDIRRVINTLTGIFTIKVGGTLHVNPNQAPGSYSGTFTVDAIYQ